MINLEFKINRSANKFFFISNLSEWHFSCMPEYNRIWIKETGELNFIEKKLLKNFTKISKKYGFENKFCLGLPFIIFSAKKALENTKENIKQEEFFILEKTFSAFEKRFSKIWKKEKIKLIESRKLLQKQLPNMDFQKFILDIETFFEKKLNLKNFNVRLLACPEEAGSMGGTALDKKNISIEVSRQNAAKDYMQIIMHEIIHLLADEKIREVLLKAEIKQNKKIAGRNIFETLNEMIISSLMPGYLSEKYFKIDFGKEALNQIKFFKNFSDDSEKWAYLENTVIHKSYKIAKNYIDNKKVLDQKYIAEIYKIINKIL